MILLKLVTCHADWTWTAGVIWWLIKRPLEGPWYR